MSVPTPFRAAAAFLAAVVLFPPAASAVSVSEEAPRAEDWLARMAAHYEAHPELKTTPGSGWKPYSRARWEYETAIRGGQPLPPPDARWKAWQATRDRAARAGAPRASWFQLGPENYGGRMLAIAWTPGDPATMYAGSAGGGLWKSTDSGASFVPVTDHLMSMAVSGVAVSYTDPDIVVIGTGELPIGLVGGIHSIGILRSTDAGATWLTTNIVHSPHEWFGFHVVEAGPNGTFLAGGNDGLWRSSDDGATWTNVLPDYNYYDVKWKPGDPNTVFCVRGDAAAGNNVKISTDDGLTWARAGTGQPPGWQPGKSKIAVTPANPDYVYALYTNLQGDDTVGLYRTTDGGATWSARNTTTNIGGPQGWYNLALAVDASNPETVIAGGTQLYRSTNGGTTLSTVSGPHVDHHDLRYAPGSSTNLWVACDGGLWESVNDGASGSWQNRNTNLVTFQFYDICVAQSDPARMAGGSQDNGTPVRTGVNVWDDGMYWMDGMVCQIDPDNADRIYGEGQYGNLQRSTNGGVSWQNLTVVPGGSGPWVTPIAIDRHNGARLYTMQNNASPSGMFRTTNGGNSWTNVSPENPQGIDISPVSPNTVWALPNQAIVSTDDGATWTDCAPFGFTTGGILRITAHHTDPQAAFCCFYSFIGQATIAYTSDRGATWENVTGDLPWMPVRDVLSDPEDGSVWYAGAEVGVWVSTNGGVNWTPLATGLPNAVVRDLEIQESSRKLLCGTFGRGAWEVDISSSPGTAAPDVAAGPIDLMLDPPAPNPARGQVALRWASRRDAPSQLVVYDVRGRVVSRLAEQTHGDGIIRKATWFLDDVAPGVYFAVLETGVDRVSRKVVVVE